MTARVQGKNEDILDYYYEKVCMCRDFDLGIDVRKEQLLDGLEIESKDLFHYLISRLKNSEDALLVDIMNYGQMVESRSARFQSKPQTSVAFNERSLS